MVRAWEAGRREIAAEDMPEAGASIARVSADVLTNRHPPWGVRGGVYDALAASGGRCTRSLTSMPDPPAVSLRRRRRSTWTRRLGRVASLVRAVEEG
jgi:cysteate synthase